jgi:putative ABC transport system permease protein
MDQQPEKLETRLNWPWLFIMAWRDSRRNLPRLFLFISSIVLGIAALVAIFSLSENAQKDIDNQAKTLVGADLAIETGRKPEPSAQSHLDSLGIEKASERSFASMIYFPKNQGSRLVQVRALKGDFPFYGNLETTPVAAGRNFLQGRKALVDQTLMLQFNASVGDTIKIGAINFTIAGILTKAPGRTGLSTTVAPPVYIPLDYLSQTGLEQRGSRISYNYYYRFAPGTDMDKIEKELGPRLEKDGLGYETVASRKRNTGRIFGDFNRFLTLIGFIALLLGCIGVASSIHIYIRGKILSIAILRCLCVSGLQAFLIYLIQVACIGLAGSMLGALLGTFVQRILPAVIKDFLPIELNASISWSSIGKGIGLGLAISLLFALLPLINIRKVSSLGALRYPVLEQTTRRDPLKLFLYLIIFGFISLFAKWQMQSWTQGVVFTVSILGAFIFLTAIAWFLRWAVRHFFPASWNYLWRQGFANLYRPNNQTLILLTTIGLGTAFIGVLYFVHSMLLTRVAFTSGENQPNMVLFDIQTNQVQALTALASDQKITILQEIPVVAMRIEQINGKTPAEIRMDSAEIDSTRSRRRRGFDGDLRVSYRDSLTAYEKITAGKWEPGHRRHDDTANISLDEEYAKRMHLKIGDKILFNVQGMLLPAMVGSLREIDWQRMQTNFRIIFPSGVLENAPQFHVITLKVSGQKQSAHFQQAVVRAYPNVSIIDLGLVLKVLEDVLDKVGFVIRFMAGFCILTGFIVLLSSVLISKYQRIQEMVLLRTLGASRKQLLSIALLEYFFLGSLAAATGIFLSLLGTWALAKFNFEMSFSFSWLPVLWIFLSVTLLTIAIGVLNSISILNKPPLEVLRTDL